MEKEEYQKMYDLERDYWWFKGKRKLVGSWISKYYGQNNMKILDIGCGTGMNMKMLGAYGGVYGLDFSNEAITFCSERNLKNLTRGSAEKIPFQDESFDIVTIFDVLSHKSISDDLALEEIRRLLKKEGRVFFIDSAMQCLWSRHDEAFHVKRRYAKNELQKKLENVGFEIEKISYFNSALFLPVFISRKLNNLMGLGPKSDIQKINPLFNKLLYWYYSFELSLLKYVDYPFGISLFAIGKKV